MRKQHQILVGFAAESDRELEYGKKMKKNLDMICINNILKDKVGFGHDTNQIEILKSPVNKDSSPYEQNRAVS